MGGKVLELESERLKVEGQAIGQARQSDRFREKPDLEA